MTPTTSEGATINLGRNMAQDRDGVAVLDDEGVVMFLGAWADAQRFMDDHGLQQYANCEVVDIHPSYMIGFEAG